MRPGFFSFLKTAAVEAQPQHNDFLDEHFSINPRWKDFKKKLRYPSFVEAVKQDTRANEKLKRYSEANAKHVQAKGVPTYKERSDSGRGSYTVKYHPDVDRYSCNCGDWVHARSHQEDGTKGDCKHIKRVKAQVEKTASLLPEGYVLSRRIDPGKDGKLDHNVIDLHYQNKNVGYLTHHPGTDGDYQWLKGMYIDPSHRGKGLSHVLLDELVKDNPNKELRLRARPFKDEATSVDALKKLYQNHGFQQYDDENRMLRKIAFVTAIKDMLQELRSASPSMSDRSH